MGNFSKIYLKKSFEDQNNVYIFLKSTKNDGYCILKSIDTIIKEGYEQGKSSRNIEIAKNMLKDNIDISIISKYTGLSKGEIEELI